MKSSICTSAVLMLLAVSVPAMAAQDGYRPQNAAQRNYKACKPEAMQKGAEIVEPICGKLPERPHFPGYNAAFEKQMSAEELAALDTQLDNFKRQVRAYQQCINKRVMANGALPTETLNYAACADQYAVQKEADSAEEWGMSCMGQNDWQHPGSDVPAQCFKDQQ